jgi:hypothetical protein
LEIAYTKLTIYKKIMAKKKNIKFIDFLISKNDIEDTSAQLT